MRKQIRETAVGVLTALAVAAGSASVHGTAAQQRPAAPAPAYEEQLVTVEGCLRRERAPDAVARKVAGDPESDEIFVLTSAEVRTRLDTVPAPAQGERAAIEGSPTPPADRYVVVGLADDRLKLFAGQRVTLAGQFEPPLASVGKDADAASIAGAGRDTRRPKNLPRFVATSIKPVAGICSPKP